MLLVSLLVLGCAFLGANGLERHTHVGLPGATTKGGFALPLHRKHQTPTQGRMLLRNSSYPLHGTVKDLGYLLVGGMRATLYHCDTCAIHNHTGIFTQPYTWVRHHESLQSL